MSWLSKLLPDAVNALAAPRAPLIRLDEFSPVEAKAARAAPEGERLISQICRHETLDSPAFRSWISALDYEWRAHRKLWELAYILQALQEAGLIAEGKRGLAFAVGQERTPALLAAQGCEIVATDLASGDERNRGWAETGQWSGALADLAHPKLCPPDLFNERVRYRAVDMNEIPRDLTGFDFTWSTCSFEHCGSLELGMRFLERQMDCLRPGGVAIHTTEFNLTSNTRTWTSGGTSIYRLRDILEVTERLSNAGHDVAPLDLRLGDHPLDRRVDGSGRERYSNDKHLRLALGRYACTSIGLIIRKAA